MSTIGIDLESDELVLVKDRDFKWAFDNLDENDTPVNYPAGSLYLELFTGGEHNNLQEVKVIGGTGGTYKLGVNGVLSGNIDFYDVTDDPRDISGDIKAALEGISGVGTGNVKVHPAKLIPVWNLSITLNTGNNEKQQIKLPTSANGGAFRLGCNNQATDNITFGATDAVVKTALESLSSIGSGNVNVAKIDNWTYQLEFVGAKAAMDMPQVVGYGFGFDWGTLSGWGLANAGLFPQIQSTTLVPGTSKLTEPLVNTINKTINDVFNSFETLLGVDLDYTITSQTNILLKATSLKSYVESDVLTFTVDVTENLIKGFLNNVAGFAGLANTVTVDFYWNHIYQVEFINAKGNQPIPKLTYDISSLVGASKAIEVTVLELGKEPTTKWPFTISGHTASIKVESEEVNKIPKRTRWHLVFLPTGEVAGGDPVSLGKVRIQE